MTLADKVLRAKQDYDDVFEAGKAQGGGDVDEYHQMMWDSLQNYGNAIEYSYFAYEKPHTGWFRPVYDIKPVQAYAFMRKYGYNLQNSPDKHIDLVALLSELGIVMDLSNCTYLHYIFYNASISHLPEINVTGVTSDTGANVLLFGAYIKTIDKIITKENLIMTTTFDYSTSLKEVRFEGVIGRDITLSYSSKLSAESAKSIISCLKDYSGTENEHSYTITFHENVWALLDAEGNASPTGTTWADYVYSLGWNM